MTKVKDARPALAKEFVSLVLPRVMVTYTDNLDQTIQQLKTAITVGGEDSKPIKDLLAKVEQSMVRVLSGEPAIAIEKFYVAELVKDFTEEELRLAVSHEKFSIKFNGLAARAEAVFKEALGEV